MFNFTTQTILNKVVVSTNGANNKEANIRLNTNGKTPALRIGNAAFNQSAVESIYKASHSNEALAEVKFDMAVLKNLFNTFTDDDSVQNARPELKNVNSITARIVLYLGLSMNSQDSFYANDFVYKGKPVYLEFKVDKGASVSAIANAAKKVADKYMLFTAEDKFLDISVETGTDTSGSTPVETASLVFKGVNGYQQFKKATLQWFDPSAVVVDCCTTDGNFVDLVNGVPVIYTIEDGSVVATNYVFEDGATNNRRDLATDGSEVAILPGIEAFGDYNWLIHNLRLPTAANYHPWSVTNRADEMPYAGGKYNQYIVTICTARDGIASGAVGQRVHSVTTHVFYVLDDGGTNISTFETALKNVLPQGKSDFEKDADTNLNAPFA